MDGNQGIKDFSTRLRAVRRSLLNQTRSEFSKKISIPEITINQWENRKTQITDSSLVKLIKGLEKYGIKISKEWLLNGVGASPFEQSSTNFQFTGDGEMETFLSLHANAILFEVSDDSYQPTYQFGDMLGAVQTNQKNLGNMDVVILEGKDRGREIKRILATKDNALFLTPVTSCCFSEAVAYKPSMKIYKIIWFKSQSNRS